MANTPLILALILPNVAGWLSILTLIGLKRNSDGKFWHETLVMPTWFPPKWIFGLAETVFYTAMGYASYAIHLDQNNELTEPHILAITLYVLQLLLNYAWAPIFFRVNSVLLSLLCQNANLVLAAACSIMFALFDPLTLAISLPYLAWLIFTNCLNYSIWKLNRSGSERLRRDIVMVNWPLITSILIPNVGGWASALTMGGQVRSRSGPAWYETISKPPWTPPRWLFGPAWTLLYTCMGYASYMIYRDGGGFTKQTVLPLTLYGIQLSLNWTWNPVFFKLHQIGLALIHMGLLDVATTACTICFALKNKNTLFFMMPYMGWLTFATCLNYTIWKLNRYSKIEGEDIAEN